MFFFMYNFIYGVDKLSGGLIIVEGIVVFEFGEFICLIVIEFVNDIFLVLECYFECVILFFVNVEKIVVEGVGVVGLVVIF